MYKREVWTHSFSDWFRDVIDRAEIIDYRYPIKACGVWRAYGFQLRKNILKIIRDSLDKTGHNEMLFPMLIPEHLLEKEATHIKSFTEEAYWVTHGGKTRLGEKLALRPTSETAITPMVKLWVRSHADLPLKIYQIGSIFRYETKATRPLIRIREVTTFKEAHTYHSSYQKSQSQVTTANEIYQKIFHNLCIPYVISERPAWDKFAGALYTYAFDTIFPDGRCLQIGTTHNLGQNFSKAFDFTFETKDGTQEFVWQTSYGISERAIAAVIGVHGDDRGLVLPPIIAPIQIVIIPILYKGFEKLVNDECQRVKRKLCAIGFRVEFDDREQVTPGSKFYEWELKGVPLRVDVGPKDIDKGVVTLVRRDTGERETCKRDSLNRIENVLSSIEDWLRERAWKRMRERVNYTETVQEARKLIDDVGGIVKIPWCGENECGIQIEEEAEARVLGVPVDIEKEVFGRCSLCGNKTNKVIRIARAY
jgi:prolyl-tRNA synthetase